MKINWKRARRYLSIATDIVHKLPDRGDGPLKILVKLLAIADSFDKRLGADNPLFDFFQKLGDVKPQSNAQFVDLFFSTPLASSFEIRKLAITDYTDIVIASDDELGKLFFIEYHYGSKPEPSSEFWHTPDFKFDKALERLWALFDNGIYISLKPEKDRTRATYQNLVFTKDPIVGPAVGRLHDLVQRQHKAKRAGFARTYLFLGTQGVGKSTFATRMAQACGTRTLKIDAKGMTLAGANDFGFLLRGISPDFLIIDDLDRITDMPAAIPTLLEALSDLKERHPSITAVLTANSIEPFDPAILRPGRIDRVIEFKEPDSHERQQLLMGYLLEFKVACDNVRAFVEATEGLTAAYLREVVIQLKTDTEDEVLATIRQMRELASKAKGNSKETATPADTKTILKAG